MEQSIQTPSIICTLFPIEQFSDIETLLPIITLFPILTFASIFEKSPIVKFEPTKDASEINELLAERQTARSSKDYARADEIRDQLSDQGVLILDSAEGSSWELKK